MAARKAATTKKTSPAKRGTRQAASKPSVPLVRAQLAVSLDGYIADKRGGVTWLDRYFSPDMDFAGFMASIGATIMGRKTYDVALKIGMPPGSAEQRNIVVSHKPPRRAPEGLEHFSGDLRKLVAGLKHELAGTGKDIWLMGGGQLIDAFRAAGLVDRLELNIIPTLLGQGIPLFPTHGRGLQGFRLTRHHVYTNGVVELWYVPDEA